MLLSMNFAVFGEYLKCMHALCYLQLIDRFGGLVDVSKDTHQNHIVVLLSRCFVDVDHVHIEVHTFIFTSLFDVDVVNGIVNLQF